MIDSIRHSKSLKTVDNSLVGITVDHVRDSEEDSVPSVTDQWGVFAVVPGVVLDIVAEVCQNLREVSGGDLGP